MEIITITVGKDGILRIGINRPDKKNALTVAMYGAMADAMEQAAQDPAVRVVLVHGHESVFSSGNDIKDFMEQPRDTPFDAMPVYRFLNAIRTAPKPLVAAVRGQAIGIGTTMLLHCDLVYCGASATFQLPFVNLALVPEAASSLLLPALAGYQRAAELLLLGETFDAQKAREVGIVTSVVQDDGVMEAALQAATTLAEKPPAALRLTKTLMKKAGAEEVAKRMVEEGTHFSERLASPEAMEAFTAFFQRRKPDFSKFS
jgi:enoyl-CoA hydratase/carnithine racemase